MCLKARRGIQHGSKRSPAVSSIRSILRKYPTVPRLLFVEVFAFLGQGAAGDNDSAEGRPPQRSAPVGFVPAGSDDCWTLAALGPPAVAKG